MESDHTAGSVLSHIEAVYRPNERQLAIALFEALGCKIAEMGTKSPAGSTYLSVRPNHSELGHDNVIYLAEAPAEQCRLDDLLKRHIDGDQELSAARDLYQGIASERPYGLSHIALRYPSFESLDKVLEGVEERMTPELKSRVVMKIFRPGEIPEIGIESLQAFVYTDIAVAGMSTFGQVFELSAYGG